MTKPSSNRLKEIWPFNEIETLCLALLVMTYAAFLLGFHVAMETMQ